MDRGEAVTMAYDLNKLKLMLVEDDFAMRALLRDVLNAFDVGEIRTAQDGSSALRQLKGYPADIVMVDWQMQPMNGMEFLKHIRQSDDTPNPFVPIVMLTALSETPRVLASRDARSTESMAKPATPKRLYNRIAPVIEDTRNCGRTPDFVGPDRRRSDRPFIGMDRRDAESVVLLD